MTKKFNELREDIIKIFSQPEGRSAQVLIGQITDSLTPPGQPLGTWEAAELDYAKHALDAGFSKLALIAASVALTVHQLSPEEYAFGFNSTWHAALKEKHASDLLADQKETAGALVYTEKVVAWRLGSTENTAAVELDRSQRKAATVLIEENRVNAVELAEAQAHGLQKLEESESKKAAHHQEREQVISWMTGGYSVETPASELPSENAHILVSEAQKKAAQELKDHQHKAATDLKENQIQIASDLKETGKQSASSLKTQQEETSIKLVEAQAIKAIDKTETDSGQK